MTLLYVPLESLEILESDMNWKSIDGYVTLEESLFKKLFDHGIITENAFLYYSCFDISGISRYFVRVCDCGITIMYEVSWVNRDASVFDVLSRKHAKCMMEVRMKGDIGKLDWGFDFNFAFGESAITKWGKDEPPALSEM